MKYADIKKIREAGLISSEQEREILAHFHLKEDGSRFMTIISFIGAVLVGCGIILLIAANWEEIPRGVKIATGLLLMLGAHGAGWWLREVQGIYRKTGEALHLVGSALFLANIALIGQIYHLSTRPPNAFLLWWVGIAALPWLLRSKAQHILSLLAFGLWFGMEINQSGSWIFFGNDMLQLVLYGLLGLIYLGGGYWLRRTSFAEFAPATEKLGLLSLQAFLFPLTWGILYRHAWRTESISTWVFPVMAGLGLLMLVAGMGSLGELTRQWRWTWGLALAGTVVLFGIAMYLPQPRPLIYRDSTHWFPWLCAVGLFVFCLLEIQVGLEERSEHLVNLGVTFIGLDIIATYLNLFGSMAQTGLMFLVSGVFLIVFGVFLEKKRRSLLQGFKTPPSAPALLSPKA